ncbi:MAG: peptidoglycan-binding protein, partial [Candidatus Staskawiczbacteria bacterium]
MSINRTIISTILALALVAVVAPGVTQGVTIDELMAQIATLQAQLTGLSGTPASTGTGACAGVTFSRNLTVGSTGSDVKCLQTILNNKGFQVAATGVGSAGYETTYFGAKTLVAVKAYQVSLGYTPANQVGPMTRAALNAVVAGGTVI